MALWLSYLQQLHWPVKDCLHSLQCSGIVLLYHYYFVISFPPLQHQCSKKEKFFCNVKDVVYNVLWSVLHTAENFVLFCFISSYIPLPTIIKFAFNQQLLWSCEILYYIMDYSIKWIHWERQEKSNMYWIDSVFFSLSISFPCPSFIHQLCTLWYIAV